MAQKAFTPQTLRGILVVILLLVIVGGGGVFYLGLEKIRTFAIEVNHTVADAEASDGQVQALQTLKNQLSQSESLIAKANQMFATPDNYQPQAITDVRNHANTAGLTITKTSFDDTTHTMTVTLMSPLSYTKLIQFLDGIEGNLPKMQVSNIGLSHVNGGGSDSVAVDDIKITISTR